MPKSKHDKLSAQAVQSENNDQSPEKLEEKKMIAHPEQQHATSRKKGKKRKKMDVEEQGEPMEHKVQLEEAERESGPPKKKHKNKTNFSDPREDTQLNTQSRKGAHYSVALARLDIFHCYPQL